MGNDTAKSAPGPEVPPQKGESAAFSIGPHQDKIVAIPRPFPLIGIESITVQNETPIGLWAEINFTTRRITIRPVGESR